MKRSPYTKDKVLDGFKRGWPLIIKLKKLSAMPLFERLARPFFTPDYNQLTALPIRQLAVNERVPAPENMVMPLAILERLLGEAAHIMILDECVCRAHMKCTKYSKDIGCLILGKAATEIHPSNGHLASLAEAVGHVHKAAAAGLVANVAHVWIDPVGFNVYNFRQMLFVCFCGDEACLYTEYLKRRNANLDRGYKRLPGIRVEIDPQACNGCGICAEKCFVGAIRLVGGQAKIGEVCKGCGRCVDVCPVQAIRIAMDDEDTVFRQLMARVNRVADIHST